MRVCCIPLCFKSVVSINYCEDHQPEVNKMASHSDPKIKSVKLDVSHYCKVERCTNQRLYNVDFCNIHANTLKQDTMKELSCMDCGGLFTTINHSQLFCTDCSAKVLNGKSVKLSSTNKYLREIKPGVFIDVYDVIKAFGVIDGGFQHAIKKLLAVGQRGHKDESEDRKDIAASIKRSNAIYDEWRNEQN